MTSLARHLFGPTLFLVFAVGVSALDAPPLVVERTEVRTLTSKENGVAYRLYISLPHGYGEPGKTFPVVYLLDANYSFLIARNITDHLSEREDLPEVILVGIAYDDPPPATRAWQADSYHRNRTRDYTPKFWPTGGYGPEMQKVSGGGPKFRSFIEHELIPFIDRTYATAPGDRTLVGHSYGGLFASWNVLTSPPLFRRYIVVSPSLWYADRWIFTLPAPRSLNARVYLAVGSAEGNSEHDMVVDLRAFAQKLRKVSGTSISIGVLEHENHNSVFPRALSNGLRFVFEGM
jgi:uncharacterized protein